ncbi:hypothetical protein EVAR_83646_1 [Eumeta japonica]|uniref:Uncharacterized protein n=1 Tax=Eumeta variegata TaxID=151549 RepID=A0A4C1UNK5_EUMVA|nr:hypothetical protein EVAR_83646_1 [Eumeta japonica]
MFPTLVAKAKVLLKTIPISPNTEWDVQWRRKGRWRDKCYDERSGPPKLPFTGRNAIAEAVIVCGRETESIRDFLSTRMIAKESRIKSDSGIGLEGEAEIESGNKIGIGIDIEIRS